MDGQSMNLSTMSTANMVTPKPTTRNKKLMVISSLKNLLQSISSNYLLPNDPCRSYRFFEPTWTTMVACHRRCETKAIKPRKLDLIQNRSRSQRPELGYTDLNTMKPTHMRQNGERTNTDAVAPFTRASFEKLTLTGCPSQKPPAQSARVLEQ